MSAFLAGIMALSLGSHYESDEPADPFGGSGYRAQDFEPTASQRIAVFVEHFIVFAVPGLLGLTVGLRGRQEREHEA